MAREAFVENVRNYQADKLAAADTFRMAQQNALQAQSSILK